MTGFELAFRCLPHPALPFHDKPDHCATSQAAPDLLECHPYGDNARNISLGA